MTHPRDDTTTLFHCSDLHFGHPAVPEQYEAIEASIHAQPYDVVAISGDLTQRARSGEFQRARAFIQHAKQQSEVIVVPGNHDVMWWKAPLGFGNPLKMLATYRRYIAEDIVNLTTGVSEVKSTKGGRVDALFNPSSTPQQQPAQPQAQQPQALQQPQQNQKQPAPPPAAKSTPGAPTRIN